MARLRVAALISGRGSNLQALIAAAAKHDYPAEISLVIANQAADGLALAERAGITTEVIAHRNFAGRKDFDAAVDARLRTHGIELVCLAGFMRVLGAAFVAAWRDRLINIHPSLLPAFPGLHTHERALAAGVRLHGCTVHFVREALDEGPIILQAAVPVLEGDDAGRLAARVLAAEHQAYPQALALVAAGRVRIEGERAVVSGAAASAAMLLNPCLAPAASGNMPPDRQQGTRR